MTYVEQTVSLPYCRHFYAIFISWLANFMSNPCALVIVEIATDDFVLIPNNLNLKTRR
jgi:hypothetical protein